MADGIQIPSASAQKRARPDDSLELDNPTISKRPRNDDDPETTEMIRAFNKFIDHEVLAVHAVDSFKRLSSVYPPHQPISFETRDRKSLVQVDHISTQILFGLFKGLVPGVTIRTNDGIQIVMTSEQFFFLKKVLIGSYLDRRHQMAAAIQRARAPPSLQLNPHLQQIFRGPGIHHQRVGNDAPQSHDFDTAVQPHTHPIQFSNTNVNPVPGPSQPVLSQAPQYLRRSLPQANGPPVNFYYKLFIPADRATEENIQEEFRQEQMKAQRHRVSEMASASGQNTHLVQQDNGPKQSSAANTPMPNQPKRKNAVQRTVNGNQQPYTPTRRRVAVIAPERNQSESAVPGNQILGQQQHIQNISHLSQLASAQTDSTSNTFPTGATPTDAIDVDQFLAIQGIQRSASVAGYPIGHPTGLGLDIPPRSHSASISPSTPITGPPATLPSTGNTPPSGTGLVNQANRPWISHYPQASQENIQNQSAAVPAREFTFLAPHGEDYSPTKNKHSGSKSREQRLSVSPGNGRQSALGSLTSRPASVPLPDLAHDKREEEEEGEGESSQADVRPAQLPPVVRPTTWALVEPRPVGGSFATSAPTQGGFAQYANQTTSFMAPPQQQQPEEQVRRPMSSATTPITPLTAPAIVPPIVAQTQQQPQVASDNSAAPSVPAALSSAVTPGPIIASDSGFGFDFNFLFGKDPPPGEPAIGEMARTSNDASQPQADSTQLPELSEFEELFGTFDSDFPFDTTDIDINSQNWVGW